MLGKTHAAVGAAMSLYVVRPHSVSGIALTLTAGIIGGLLCDIDSSHTELHKKAALLGIASLAIIVTGVATGRITRNGSLLNSLMQNEAVALRILCGAGLFLISFLGSFTHHRSFTHSIVFTVMVYWLMLIAFYPAARAITAGVTSHIAIDFLNERGEKLFWPINKRFSLKLCSSDGTVNKAMFYMGVGATILLIFSAVI